VAYLKFSRDKRGYEHFYLVQPSNRGKARPRMLYWFRTPPGVKVGRSPFDPDMRRALEAQNPDVVFDWEAIANTPIPRPVEPERWRERRRVERAFREDNQESDSIPDAREKPEPSEITIVDPAGEPPVVAIEELQAVAVPEAIEEALLEQPMDPASQPSQGGVPRQDQRHQQLQQHHQGRRRRRRRGRRKPQVQGSGFPVPGSQVAGSEVQGPKSDNAQSQEPDVQDSGEPDDET
jgi:hypothetical protein